MVKRGLGASELKAFGSVNSFDLKSKVKGRPLTLTMICCHVQSSLILGFGEEDFQRVFTLYWHGGQLGQNQNHLNKRFPSTKKLNCEI